MSEYPLLFVDSIFGSPYKTLLHLENKIGADQPAHACSLIRAFVIHCLKSMIAKYVTCIDSRFFPVSVAEQAALTNSYSEILKIVFLAARPFSFIPFLFHLNTCVKTLIKDGLTIT